MWSTDVGLRLGIAHAHVRSSKCPRCSVCRLFGSFCCACSFPTGSCARGLVPPRTEAAESDVAAGRPGSFGVLIAMPRTRRPSDLCPTPAGDLACLPEIGDVARAAMRHLVSHRSDRSSCCSQDTATSSATHFELPLKHIETRPARSCCSTRNQMRMPRWPLQ